MTDLHVEHIGITRLTPYNNNSRTHSDEQIHQIAQSIQEFGFVNPILVDDQNVLIAGHGRLAAAQLLGLDKIPVIQLKHLDESQRRALVIADNRIALNAGWDESLLRDELQSLLNEDFNMDVLGFDDKELDKLLYDFDSVVDENLDDLIPKKDEKPVSKLGDLWILGNHKLLCGDATSVDDLKTLLQDELVDMTFTDPPYNVSYGTQAQQSSNKKRKNSVIENDSLGDSFQSFLFEVCKNMLSVTKGACYICMSSSEIDTLKTAFEEAGGKWSTFVIWAKNHFTLGRSDYQRQYEPILYGWKDGNDHLWNGGRDQGDIWFYNKPSRNDLHPTMKPVELVERALTNSSKTLDIVLDPFGGSGSTLIACEKNSRQARVIELDPQYVDIIIKRWQHLTNLQAIHAETSEAFSG